ncbi:restriction endonuclease [Frankia sp. Cr1]|uniref:restriction endonuclease n=1 Tax=Frankia sp. Cr1 TaxID=3073931 RepID=UPI002AD3E7A9|nr:restriction endonuclease [Frankia sp. Cr1]
MQSGGGQSEWQQRRAAAVRAEREATQQRKREAAAQAKQDARDQRDREQAQRQQSVDDDNAAATAHIAELGRNLLLNVLGFAAFTVSVLEAVPEQAVLRPGRLSVPGTAPNWEDYAPPAPGRASRLVGGSGRYQRELDAARIQWEADTAEFQRAEADRLRALDAARARHDQHVTAIHDRAAAHNARLAAQWAACMEGDPEAVEWFVGQALAATSYPDGFPVTRKIAYRPQEHDIVVEVEFPRRSVIPEIREYKLFKTAAEVRAVKWKEPEIKKLYAQLVAWMTLRIVHEVFEATKTLDLVDVVVFNGTVTDVAPATGKDTLYHLVSLEPERSLFESSLELDRVTDPIGCLRELGAKVSPNPYDLEAVKPVVTFDLRRFRLANDATELSDLDSRPNLLQLTPSEFEKLIEKLLKAMGIEAYRTVDSRDDGIDVVATKDDIIFGGICLVQAKRTKNRVELGTVQAVAGSMNDHNAATGMVVTTSWYGPSSIAFAKRNRITLIKGAELKHMIRRYLDLDVIPGVVEPRGRRGTASS